ncbi:hypothetical protein C4D60_Mb04t25330 [Musa balbisiana]|uniref:GED domain-containing protein n=1 Tax=Musa balbisiana TaxID=52838 RepID=A0A4S8KEP9_MUSBA|nr:hypothetical protein C4D60_Mb04t25330 [Musa balbisiana]
MELSRLGKPIAADTGSTPCSSKRLQFDKHLSMENVRKTVTEADGYQPHLIAPEQGYRRLIESSVVSIRGPAESAVDSVHAILKDLVHKAINETHELKQYPTLRVEVGNAAVESLERMREESKKATLKLVDMECSYLTVDFFRKLPQDVEKGGNPTHSLFDRYNDSYLRRVGTTVLAYVNMVCASLRNSIPKSIVYCQVREAKRSLLDHFFTDLGKREQLVYLKYEPPEFHLYYMNSCSVFYDKKVHGNHLKWDFRRELGKQLGKLLDEDPAIMERRTALAKRLELYRSAQAEIDSVAWANK